MDESNKVIPLFSDEDDQAAKAEQAQTAPPRPSAQEWKQAFQHLFQSVLGKYTLESYLESLSEFTDGEIRDQLENGLTYLGGEASFTADRDRVDVTAAVCLEFQNRAGQWRQRKAERHLCKSMFTQETVRRLENAGELRFEIYAPGKE